MNCHSQISADRSSNS